MAAPTIGLRQQWAPGPNAQIDQSHPLAAGLTFYDWFPNGQPREKVVTKTSTGPGATRWGNGAAASGAAGVATTARPDMLPNGAATHILVGQWTLASGTYLSQIAAATLANGEFDWYRSTNAIRFYADANTGTFHDAQVLADGRNLPVVLGASITAAPLTSLYVNGVFVSSASNNGAVYDTSTASGIGCSNAGASGVPGTVNLYAIWNRTLSAAEHAQMAADPYCVLRR